MSKTIHWFVDLPAPPDKFLHDLEVVLFEFLCLPDKAAHQSYPENDRNAPVVPNWSHLFNAAVVCTILESISGLEPSSDANEPRHLKLVTVSSFRPFTLISLLMPLVFFVIYLLFSALISMP